MLEADKESDKTLTYFIMAIVMLVEWVVWLHQDLFKFDFSFQGSSPTSQTLRSWNWGMWKNDSLFSVSDKITFARYTLSR